MDFIPSPTLPEIIIIESRIFEDDRGFFTEMYHKKKFE
ncbi:MAG: dTDP-4-dehydrorhamnose 3,5-epimerase family protein, partial [Deltaproteobacteria bacterium]|nr:dTDP-4-dehydrorhamnose 3,5-epimerase family protein [Deltaproteobacteria bacterium]